MNQPTISGSQLSNSNKSGKRGQAERAERAIQTRAMGKNDMRKFANQSKASVAWCLGGRLQSQGPGFDPDHYINVIYTLL